MYPHVPRPLRRGHTKVGDVTPLATLYHICTITLISIYFLLPQGISRVARQTRYLGNLEEQGVVGEQVVL